MFRSIIDHRQLQVVHDEFEFHLKLQCELALRKLRKLVKQFCFDLEIKGERKVKTDVFKST